MTEEHSADIAVMKMQIAEHEKQFDRQWKIIKAQGTILDNISKSLLQIKYLAIGAVGFWLLDQIGLVEAIKKIF